MRIVILGTRGFPNVQGGVEKHCQELTPHLVKLGNEVIVLTRKSYVDQSIKEYYGVKLVPLPTVRIKSLEAVSHTFIGVFAALKYKPDILHIQSIGQGLFVPLARILGMKVVLTTHGSNYKHKKWGKFAQTVLRLAEYVGIKYSNAIIAVSNNITLEARNKYGRNINFIPNGVNAALISKSTETLLQYGLEKCKYILSVGRFVPEKAFETLIKAFAETQVEGFKGYKLVIAGTADHKDFYSQNLIKLAQETDNVILTGFITGKPLEELYSHAALFVLPSYYEGLPIVLLEAFSYGLSCIGSDIVANREVGLEEERYFMPGDIHAIAKKIIEFSDKPLTEDQKQKQIHDTLEKYDWFKIAKNTNEIYKEVCGLSLTEKS